MGIMGVSYIAEEAGIEFEFPFTLELDNQAAIIFCEGSASKTRLKHIDTRQQWVQMLRDKNLVVMDKVPTDSNLADLFTKILPKPTFVKLRDQLLKDRPSKSSLDLRPPLHSALVEGAKTNMGILPLRT